MLKATIVFLKNWEAIHKKNDDGSRSYRYIIHEGSSRSSKTYSLIDTHDLYARENHNKRITIWRDTKTDCKKTVLVDMLKHHKTTNRYKVGYDFNKTESIFHYINDSTVEIHGTDDEETVHGLTQDVAHLNEPYKISKDTFDQIDQRTSDFVFIDWNPKKEHWIDDLKKDKRTIVIKSTFRDNPFCPTEQRHKILSYQPLSRTDAVENKLLSYEDAYKYDVEKNVLNLTNKQLKELSRCRLNEDKRSSDSFKWDVYGLGNKGERPNRIFKFKEIPYLDYLKIDVPVYYGVDWGSVDPFGIIQVKYLDGKLYIHELNYDSENKIREKLTPTELMQIANNDEGLVQWLFNKLGIEKDRPIICDNNRKSKIIALRVAGYDYAIEALKPKGSIVDGIDLLNSLDVYYTSTSENTKYEQENYSRKVDRHGAVLEEPEDKDNHCFVGDTLISTTRGLVPIKNITTNDYVYTSNGVNKVLKKFNNGIKKTIYIEILTDIFSLSLHCTETHKIKTKRGWIKAKELNQTDVIYLHKSLMEKCIINIEERDISQKALKRCTELCGNTIMEIFLKAMMFITLTMIKIITKYQTLTLLIENYMLGSQSKKGSKKTLNGLNLFKKKELIKQKSGTSQRKVENGTENRLKNLLESVKRKLTNAKNVLVNTKQSTLEKVNFAQITANLITEEKAELTMSLDNAENVEKNLLPTNIVKLKIAHQDAQEVYDLMIDKEHEYFANGVLVHNCLDPARYVAQFLKSEEIIRIIS